MKYGERRGEDDGYLKRGEKKKKKITYPSRDNLHSTLLRVLEGNIWIAHSQAQTRAQKPHCPTRRPSGKKKHTIVQPMPVIRNNQMHMASRQVRAQLCFRRGQKDFQGNVGIHEDGIAVVPEEPGKAVLGGFGQVRCRGG